MNEILFCGKSIDNNEWISGYLYITNEYTYIIYQEEFDDNLLLTSENIFIKVYPETICQYTGKCDKKGIKIFENFIIKENYQKCLGVVKFGEHDKGYGYYIQWLSKEARHYRMDFLYWQKFEDIEVIGNIFDNSEFLD